MIFTDGLADGGPRPISELHTGLGDYLGAKVSEAAADWPVRRIGDIYELSRAGGGKPIGGVVGDALGAIGLNDERPVPEGTKRLSLSEANAKLKSEGLDGAIKLTIDGVAEPALDIMMARARARRERESTIERGPDGLLQGALGVGTSFLVGAVDPLNIAAAFIPVVGQARYAEQLAAAGLSTVGRAGVRARVGAIEGAVGQAMLEPINAVATRQEGGDYTLASALNSIMFGGALGTGLRTGGGAIADLIRNRRSQPLYPFNVGEPGSDHPAWSDLSTLGPAEPLAARPESPFLPGRTPDFESVLQAGRRQWLAGEPGTAAAEFRASPAVSPHVEALADLPPRAREDLLRVSVASLINGEPVKAGEVLAAANDPRIRESLDLIGRPESRDSARRVGRDVAMQLQGAGMGGAEAKVNAAIMVARYATRGWMLGRDPHELYRADNVTIRGGATAAEPGRSFQQADVPHAPRVPFRPEFPDVVIQQGPRGRKIKDHPRYEEAKAGDTYAAHDVVSDMIDERAIAKLKALIGDRKPVLVPVHAEEAAGRNKLPRLYAEHIGHAFGLSVDSDILQINRPHRTGSDAVYRLKNRAEFDGPVVAGRDYLLVDDAVTQGGTLADLRNYIEGRGGHVIGATTLIGARYSHILAPRRATLARLREQLPQLEPWWKAQFGHGFEALTESELHALGKFKSTDAIRDRIAPAGRAGIQRAGETSVAREPRPGGEPGGGDAGGSTEVDPAKKFFQSAPAAPVFYSAVLRTIETGKLAKGSPDQWLATIRNTPGVKSEELEWLGLADWLKEQKGAVTQERVAEFVRANQIEVKEVTKGLTEAHMKRGEVRPGTDPTHPFDVLVDGAVVERAATREEAEAKLPAEIAMRVSDEAPTKFSQWQMKAPGAANYRELLLTLPPKEDKSFIETTASHEQRRRTAEERFVQAQNTFHDVRGTAGEAVAYTEMMAAHDALVRAREPFRGADPMSSNFRSSHFPELNLLAHVRFNDRTIDGRRTLFIEEIQSDWHQQGREKGYKVSEDGKQRLTKQLQELQAERSRLAGSRDPAERARYEEVSQREADLTDEYNKVVHDGVPDAPFKTAWPELALKRMIRYAAENGYDQIAWTPGHVQAERYDLSKQISRIRTYGSDNNMRVSAWDHNGKAVMDLLPTSPEKLADKIGKELAEKILTQKPGHNEMRELSGLDLQVGGEGMSGFYDKMLPIAANKLGKKYGARVGQAELSKPNARKEGSVEPQDGGGWKIVWDDGTFSGGYGNRNNADVALRLRQKRYDEENAKVVPTVHTLPITPELRDAAVSQGFPLFQAGETEPRGRITLASNRAVIDLFQSADKSTFLHEAGHLFLDQLAHDAQIDNVPQALKDDLGTVLRWLGVTRVEDIGVPQHEQWARGFEQYLMTGEAPSNALSKAFQAFREWLSAIYRSLRDLGEPLPDDIRSVMDRMLATGPEIAERRGSPMSKREAWDALSRPAPDETPAIPAKVDHPASLQPQEIMVGLVRETPKMAKAPEIPESGIVTTAVKAKAPRGRAAADPQTWSLFEFLASKGGLAPDQQYARGDLQAILDTRNFVPGFGPLIRRGGMTLDRAREAAVEAGYLVDTGELAGREATVNVNTLLEAIDAEVRGQRQYRAGVERAAGIDPVEQELQMSRALDAHIEEAGIGAVDPAIHSRAVEIMQKERVRDPDVALERAIMENSEQLERVISARHEVADRIAGWDGTGRDSGIPDDGGPASRAGGQDQGVRSGADASGTQPGAQSPAGGGPDRFQGEPVPAKPQRLTGTSASAKAAAAAEKLAQDEYDRLVASGEITERDREALDRILNEIDSEADSKARVVREGAGCLAGGYGFAATAPTKQAGSGVKVSLPRDGNGRIAGAQLAGNAKLTFERDASGMISGVNIG